MPLTVTIFFDDNTPIDPGVNLQLLSSGSVVATALTGNDGTVTFNVDPSTLTSPRSQPCRTADAAPVRTLTRAPVPYPRACYPGIFGSTSSAS